MVFRYFGYYNNYCGVNLNAIVVLVHTHTTVYEKSTRIQERTLTHFWIPLYSNSNKFKYDTDVPHGLGKQDLNHHFLSVLMTPSDRLLQILWEIQSTYGHLPILK